MTQLLDLPDEVLKHIAAFLDFESLIAFSEVKVRLLIAAGASRTSVRIRSISKSLLGRIQDNARSIRKLDISNCVSKNYPIDLIIFRCEGLRELNVANTRLVDVDSLFGLRKLRKLSFTVSAWVLNGFQPAFASLRELHIEIQPGGENLRFVMRLLNFCENIEVVHMHLLGPHYVDVDPDLPVLVAERWGTLHTVVCYHDPSDGGLWGSSLLLRAIFAHNPFPEIREMIEQRMQECFIYESGHCNLGVASGIPQNTNNVKLLERFHSIHLSPGDGGAELFASPWGSPRSIRVVDRHRLLTEMKISPSTALTELDLTECHGDYAANYRLDLITSTPCLQVLAYPLCLFLPTKAKKHVAGDSVSLQQKSFAEALGKLRLRKLFVKGVCRVGKCGRSCSCNTWRCRRCMDPLTANNLIDLSGLQHLEEMTFNGINLENCAYEKMANGNVRVARLCLNSRSGYSGLRHFLRYCSRLEHFKFESYFLDVTSACFWECLTQGFHLKQLCVVTGRMTGPHDPPELYDELREAFLQVLRRVDYMHLHIHNDFDLFDHFKRIIPDEHLKAKIDFPHQPFRSRLYNELFSPCYAPLRSLCVPEIFVGVVPPIGWDRR